MARLTAPTVFSFVRNPSEATRFVELLEGAFRTNRDVYIDMSGVTELTSDAVVVLLSRLSDTNFTRGMWFGGNEPRDEKPKFLLNQSGFFSFVTSRRLKEPPENGRIRRKISTEVESQVADELIGFATSRMTGKVGNRRAAYLSLVECMSNTHEHSSKEKIGVNSWWANVYCPPNGKSSFFTIADNGSGIFRSVTVRRWRRKMRKLLLGTGNPALLKDILEGKIKFPSRTGLRNRGKGLKAIHKRHAQGRDGMANLVIIANDVYANVAENRYESLTPPFRGTLVYWEVRA